MIQKNAFLRLAIVIASLMALLKNAHAQDCSININGQTSPIIFLCKSELPATITVNTPGGALGGIGVIGNQFNPIINIPGTFDVTYVLPGGVNGCTQTTQVIVDAPSVEADIIIPTKNFFCISDPVVNLLGNAPPNATGVVFSLDGNLISNNKFDPAQAGTGIHVLKYQFTSSNGCPTADSLIINVAAQPILKPCGLQTQYCATQSAVPLTGCVVGNAGTFSGNGVVGGDQQLFDPSIAGVGVHTITHSYIDNVCSKDTTFTITVTAGITINFKPLTPPPFCANIPQTFVYNGLPLPDTAQVQWIANGAQIIKATNDSLIIVWSETGDQEVVLEVTNVACEPFPTTKHFDVQGIEMQLPESVSLNQGDMQELNAQATSSAGNITYLWTPSNQLSCAQCAAPLASPTATTTYILTATDAAGCKATDSITVNVILTRSAFIPNVFTPNGDYQNDEIKVLGNNIVALKFQIFDRWGGLMFETTDPEGAWDGTLKGSEVQQGVYIYAAEITFDNNEVLKKQGSITLVR